jgi:hypothetical protein
MKKKPYLAFLSLLSQSLFRQHSKKTESLALFANNTKKSGSVSQKLEARLGVQ